MNSPDMQIRARYACQLLEWARGMFKEIEKITDAADVLLNPDLKAGKVRTLLKSVTNDYGFFDDIDTKPFMAKLVEVIEHEKKAVARKRTGERQTTYRRKQRKADGNVTYIVARKRNPVPKANGAVPEEGPHLAG